MKRFLIVSIGVLLIFSLVACNKTELKPPASIEEAITKTETGYAFAGMDWSVTKAQAMEQLNVTSKTVAGERETDEPLELAMFVLATHSDELDADGYITYNFIDKDNQLYSGQYWLHFNDKPEACVRSKLKEMASASLGEPKNSWLQWDDGTRDSVYWIAQDDSFVCLQISVADDKSVLIVVDVTRPPIHKDDLAVPPAGTEDFTIPSFEPESFLSQPFR